MTLLHPSLPIAMACVLAWPARSLVLDHPDEVATTLAWIDHARGQAAPAAPPALPPVATAQTEAALTLPFSDPFGLRQQDAAAPAPAEPPRHRPPSHGEEDAPPAADPQDATPLPPLRLLGSLQQDGVVQALVDIAGTTYRLGQGDALPGGLGKVAAVSEDSLDITDGATTRTIRTEPPASAGSTSPSRSPRQVRRRLIRPGAPA